MVEALLGTGASCNATEETLKKFAFMFAAETGSDFAVEPLLRFGVDPNATDVEGLTALHYAAFKGYEDIVRLLLLDRSIKVEESTWQKFSGLLKSFDKEDQVLEALLEDPRTCEGVICCALTTLGEQDAIEVLSFAFESSDIDLSDSRVVDLYIRRAENAPTWS